MSRTRKLGAVPLALVTAAALTACGATDGSSGTDEAGDTLTIGLASILAGPAATTGVAMDCGVMAYLDRVNDDGGVAGRTFDYIERDTQFDPAKAAAIAREFAGEDVFAVLTAGSAAIEAILPIFERESTAVFGLGDGAIFSPPDYDGAFGLNPDYRREAAGGAQFILENLKETSASVAYLNTGVGQPAGDAFPEYFDENGGSTDSVVSIDATATDFAPYAQKLKDAGSPVVYAVALDTQVAALQKASTAIGYDPTWVTWSVAYTPSYLEIAGDLANGVYVSQFTLPHGDEGADPAAADYVELVGERCPDYVDSTAAAQGWTIGAIIEKGVKDAADDGTLTRQAFIDAIAGSELDEVGLLPTLTYSDETHAGATAVAYAKIDGGGLVDSTDYLELPEP